MAGEETGWDPRPLPEGWSLGYDEENQKCCYFHYETTPPSISYIHPLDIGLASNNAVVTPTTAVVTERASRPLPRPPGAAPAYEGVPLEPPRKESLPPAPPYLPPPSPTSFLSSSSKQYLASPSSKPTYLAPSPKRSPQRLSTVMQSTPARLSTAQQLYASSFASRGPSMPSLPPPLFPSQSDSRERTPLYKYEIAAHISSTSSPALRPRSPASTISSLSSNMSPRPPKSPSLVYTPDPHSPPYTDHSFSDEDHRTPSIASSRLSSTSQPRGRTESDGYFRTSITTQVHDSTPRTTRATTYSTPYQTRSLFPLQYLDTDGNKPREIRTVSTTTMKAPLGPEAGTTQVQARNQNSASPFLSHSSIPSAPPQPGGQILLGASANMSGQATSTPYLPMLPVQPGVSTQPASLVPLSAGQTSFLVPPPPPPQPYVQQQPQQAHGTSVRPQSFVQPQFLPLQPQQPQQPQQPTGAPPTSSNVQPQKPTKPNKKTGFMSSLGSSFAISLGKTAGQLGTQTLLSNIGIEEEDDDNEGGVIDALASGFSSLTAGGDSGGGSGNPGLGTDPAPPLPTGTEYAPPPDPGVYYAQDPGAVPPPQPASATGGEYYTTEYQYASYSAAPPSIELQYSNGGHSNHHANTQSTNTWNPGHGGGGYAYPSQVHLPNGAQQPSGPLQALRPVQHQPQSPGWNPYQ
ncbi:hypothetical protein P691DRAFT_799938 [Macrolepiota fuliginosa MF-IS2]|uniref:WW domain-containing protein n=1 Tax=Macrolepiota fuliginosa MF-IS2 TaxID=1400762 RepID=A0A9P6CAE7_9AGAR|nr:hypothetical protein P691DRAFT_799938 [Macrolepiota fuliginosa MF-IS2]